VAAVSKYVAGSLSIAAGGTFNIGNANLYHSNAASTITNAGTLAKTGGTGTTTIDNLLVNSGTLKIASGAINLTGGFTNTGTISSVA
ncbi:hypothetical protein ACKI2C_50370, partial [Streptomyces brasiliscabiei]|uniref:hypothetical protein n=1 Tax=Streptomyces brasiliscabiei TaxID=2736302 RepID=UPI0038F6480F